MFNCPGCGGQLLFDISSQLLSCNYCHNFYEPFDFDPDKGNAEESKDFTVTVFTCPSCGGEIYSTDNSISGFCSFCGSSSFLRSRIEKTGRPDYIIPFTITKDQCKKSYTQLMKRSIFAPKELRDPDFIDGFRGIYMPYWAYHVDQNGTLNLNGEKSHQSGNYIITDHYRCSAEVSAYYKGISYDASSSFDDNISESLAPYVVKEMKGFTPAYLSGFYADTSDLDAYAYIEDAVDFAATESAKKISSNGGAFPHMSIDYTGIDADALNTKVVSIDLSLFPVWFLSYKKGDRVAYATINGQTGKAVCDVPIDPKKFLGFSFLFAIPIFLLLFLDFYLQPVLVSGLVAILALVVLFLYAAELKAIIKREEHANDYGYLLKQNKSEAEKLRRSKKQKKERKSIFKSSSGDTNAKSSAYIWLVVIFIFGDFGLSSLIAIAALLSEMFTSDSVLGSMVLWSIILGGAIAANIICYKRFNKVPGEKGRLGITATIVSVSIAGTIAFLHSVSYQMFYIPFMAYDWWFYIGTILIIIAMYLTFFDMIRSYNILSTRRPPQFDNRGGDNRA